MTMSFSAPSGGLLDSVASIASAGGISLGSEKIDPWLRSVTTIISESYLAPHVDQAKIILADDNQSPEFSLGDSGDIQLGYLDGELAKVFTGEIVNLKTSLTGEAALTVCNGGYRLSQMRLDQSFEQQSAGDIVQELADLAEVETDTIEAGVNLPFYVLDSSRNLYQHIALLAEKSGYFATINGEGKLSFKAAPKGGPLKEFHYGQDILQLTVTRTAPPIDKITLVGAGAAGSEGAEAWNWLIKDPQPVTSTLGDGSCGRLVIDPSIRSMDGLQQASAGKMYLARIQTVKAQLRVLGSGEIQAGCKVELLDMTREQLNGTGIVESVRHYYSKEQGFISDMTVLMEEGNSLDSLLAGGV